eukprot:GHVR01192022.1.p2 GENE.GHVR01192022.1~~GHVR01192022.1.p2  ORF type:complete len:188 (+),score=12.32 GHVR01192022.1:477-1040(+)
MARKAGHADADIAFALHVLPGEAVLNLDQRGVLHMNLDDILWHLDLLYGATINDTEMAQASLEKLMREPNEPAYKYGKRVLILASASHVIGENLDVKAQRAFVAGINCDITGPELRYAREDPYCTMDKLLEVARNAEMHYRLKRIDPLRVKETPTKVDTGAEYQQLRRVDEYYRGNDKRACSRIPLQ